MAKELVRLICPTPESISNYELFLDKNTLSQLAEKFQGSFIPILLAGEGDTELENSLPAEFVNASEGDCLLVWPEPVVVQGRSFLLIKMWDFDIHQENEGMVEAVKRSLSVFLSLSEHCVDSLEFSPAFHDLCFLQQVYEGLHKSGMHRMHFVVLEQRKANRQSYERAVKNKSSEAQFTDFLPRAEWQDSTVFFSRLLNGMAAPVFGDIKDWGRALHLALRFANIYSDRSDFLANFPNFAADQYLQIGDMLEHDEQQQGRLRSASALKFIVRINNSYCELGRPVIDTLLTAFDQPKPIVVLTVIGEPGIGKSTFLNHLIRRAFHSRSLRPFFEMGSIQKPTRDSFILSCPLSLQNSHSQVLLVDLEGVSNAASLSEDEVQLNLVSGVLAFTSLPCFIVKNDQQKLVEKCIGRFVFLSKTFGYQCSRIYLLSNDEDFSRDIKPDVNMQKRIDNLNEKFFEGRPVIRAMNKPSFDNPSKAEMCCEFLDSFLADCDYPKCNILGESLTTANMLAQLQSIAQPSSTEQIVVDFANIDAPKKAMLKRHKAKSERLLYFEEKKISIEHKDEAGQSPSFYSVHIEEDVMAKLLENFANCDSIMPIFSIGNSGCGRSTVLDSILMRELREFCDVDEAMEGFSHFDSNGSRSGIYVWPFPVRLGSITLLLFKMWEVNLEDSSEALRSLNSQVLSALLCVTSVCIVCAAENRVVSKLKAVHQLYQKMNSSEELAVSKFIAFGGTDELESFMLEETLCELLKNGLLKFLSREREIEPEIDVISSSSPCIDELCGLLADPNARIQFFETHQDALANERSPIQRISLMFSLLMRIVNLDLDYESFKGEIPRFSDGEFEKKLENFQKRENYINRVRSGISLKFYDVNIDRYELNSSVIETLQRNYDLQKPTIVMVIIGGPGLGKSTLLNHMIRKCTGSRLYRELFKTGNSNKQTTKASQVFSQPLFISGRQLMLIDLEGLWGTETCNTQLNLLQVNLVSAILTVASVPCIIVRNEANIFSSVEKIISKVCQLKDHFGFKIDRVHLLFQDREAQFSDNPEFAEFIQVKNHQYFEEHVVLKLRDKPNFTSSGKVDMCRKFVHRLLADSLFPKRNHSGTYINISKILVEMQYIMTHHNTDIAEIRFSEVEKTKKDLIETTKLEQLSKIESEVVCTNQEKGLVIIFNEKFQEFIHLTNLELDTQSENVKKHVRMTLENQAGMHRMKLAKIEYCYRSVMSLTGDELSARMEQHLDYIGRISWSRGTFLKRANDIHSKLHQISLRYPQAINLEGVLQRFEKMKTSLCNSYKFNYTLQFASVSTSAARTATALGLLAAGIVGTAKYLSTCGFGKGLTDTAFALLHLKNERVELSENVSTLLEKMENINVFVMMMIGTKRTKSSFLLNEFVSHISPFTSDDNPVFVDSEVAQVLHFYYQCPYRSDTDADTCGLIIYLCMDNNTSSLIEQRLATKLISRVSLTCMLFDSPDQYAQPILDTAFSPSEARTYPPSFRPKIAAFYHGYSTRFCDTLASLNVPSVIVPVKAFTEQSLRIALTTVSSEFDKSAALSSSDLRTALENAISGINAIA